MPERPCAPGALACHRFLQNRSEPCCQCLAPDPKQACVTEDQQQATGRCYDLLPASCAFTGAEHTADHYLHHNRYMHRGDNDGPRWNVIRLTPVHGLRHRCIYRRCCPLSGLLLSYKKQYRIKSYDRMTVSTFAVTVGLWGSMIRGPLSPLTATEAQVSSGVMRVLCAAVKPV